MNEEHVADPERLRRQVEESIRRLETEARQRSQLARTLRPVLGKGVLENPRRLQRVLEQVVQKLPPSLEANGIQNLVLELRNWATDAPKRLRQYVARHLQEYCKQKGLTLEVVRREDPVEVRIPPFSLVLDFPRGRAAWRFARESLREMPLDVGLVLKTYEQLRREFEQRALAPADFFQRCLRAYRETLAAVGGQPGDRVEFEHFLPRLALQMQERSFRRDPRQKNYREYSRAHFAYDVWRLRREGLLSHGGWRLNLGVATGATAQQKERVIYFEDETGRGEYKLTIFFTRNDEGERGQP
ncbi:MAG: hypothetical protein KatS3mg076_2055 [Candidatus Binatia bacterium]|nr:MAG: hypothetical protein KatS3mg076_2055 [Candidatus Binatia bacterium]